MSADPILAAAQSLLDRMEMLGFLRFKVVLQALGAAAILFGAGCSSAEPHMDTKSRDYAHEVDSLVPGLYGDNPHQSLESLGRIDPPARFSSAQAALYSAGRTMLGARSICESVLKDFQRLLPGNAQVQGLRDCSDRLEFEGEFPIPLWEVLELYRSARRSYEASVEVWISMLAKECSGDEKPAGATAGNVQCGDS